jgi:hypothetical protein
MKLLAKIIICLSLVLAISTLNQARFAKHFEPEVKKMVESFYKLDTSKAFSIAMKLFVSVDGMTDELNSPNRPNSELS